MALSSGVTAALGSMRMAPSVNGVVCVDCPNCDYIIKTYQYTSTDEMINYKGE